MAFLAKSATEIENRSTSWDGDDTKMPNLIDVIYDTFLLPSGITYCGLCHRSFFQMILMHSYLEQS